MYYFFVFLLGYKVYKCHLGCVASSHYHCGFCPRIIVRKELFHNHFQKCCNQHPSALVTTGQSVAMPSSTSVPTPMATADVTTAQATSPATSATTAVTVTAGSARTLGIAQMTASVNADVVTAQMVSSEKATTTTETATLVTAPESTAFVFTVPASARTYSKIVTSKDNKITCCLCNMQLLRKNLKMHMQRQHPSNIRRVLIHVPQRFTASANCLSE